MDKLLEAKRVFDIEIDALEKTKNALDDTFIKILDLITKCDGKVILTGMGKSGHIAKKLAATFASLGTPAFWIHPGEAMHGDLGMVSSNDVVIAISFSGESDEILNIIPNIKMIGAKIVGITGNPKSTLAQAADIIQIFPKFTEACYLGMAPTSSTTVALCYGDALAVVASGIYGFRDVDFGKYHPAGNLGKRLILRVKDLMFTSEDNPIITQSSSVKDAIIELSEKGHGAVSVIDNEGTLIGIITDGDLRRQLQKGTNIYSMKVENIMSSLPKTIQKEKLAIDALNIMKKWNISCLVVEENNKPIGLIVFRTIIEHGIVG